MPNTHQQSNDFYPNHKPVPVICSFDGEGNIRPMYVRIDGEAYKICSSYKQHSATQEAVFQCEIADNGILKTLTLTFWYDKHLWLMPK